jgi:ferric-dicitrate binding protein FerR (iron transport regulator)
MIDMDHSDVNTLIRKSLTGELSDEEKVDLERLLKGDPALKEKYKAFCQLRHFSDRYRQYKKVNARRALKEFKKEHFPHLYPVWSVWAAAVSILVLVVSGFWFFRDHRMEVRNPQLPREALVAMNQAKHAGLNAATFLVKNRPPVSVTSDSLIAGIVSRYDSAGTIVTRHDKEFWMSLPDGTRVHLNYNSRLTYPMEFEGDSRQIELEGEAYFFVAKDKRHPFIVKTNMGDVKEYGTDFNVNTREENGSMSIVLVNGSISVTSKNGTPRILKPGEMAVIKTAESTPVITKVDVMPYVAWNTGRFVFDDCSLSRLMSVLSRWYDKKVVFNISNAEKLSFTGILNRYESLDVTIRALRTITGLEINVDGGNIIIGQESRRKK